MTAPTPPLPAFTAGQVVDAAQLNDLSAQVGNLYDYVQGGFLSDRPMASVGISRENSEIPTNANTQVKWDYDQIDTDHLWSGIVSEILLLNTPGTYRVGLHVALQPVATTSAAIVAARISARPDFVNHDIAVESIAAGFGQFVSGLGGSAACTTSYNAPVAGHTLRAWVTHTAGATAALDPGFGGCRFWAVWEGPPS